MLGWSLTKKIIFFYSKTLTAFRKGEFQVLVSSDAMTRGMDVEGVRNVINYDMPKYIKTYVHRAGRTARAGQTGRCFTLMSKDEVWSHLVSLTQSLFVLDLCFISFEPMKESANWAIKTLFKGLNLIISFTSMLIIFINQTQLLILDEVTGFCLV